MEENCNNNYITRHVSFLSYKLFPIDEYDLLDTVNIYLSSPVGKAEIKNIRVSTLDSGCPSLSHDISTPIKYFHGAINDEEMDKNCVNTSLEVK